MSIFNYTLASGAEFVVRGPAGATQAQADRIFYEQVAAGSLVGYEAGQTLTSTATQVTKFELSRLDRGTAGVDNFPILAIIQGLSTSGAGLSAQSIIQGLSSLTAGAGSAAQSILASVQNLPIPVRFPVLTDVPLTDPIDESDVVLIKGDDFPPVAVGSGGVRALTEYQVQKLLAQIAALVDQESDQISRNKGIGRYGFTAYQLEQAGYVKPGTSLRFFAVDPEDFVEVMSSPSVWTGRGGVYSLTDILTDPNLQNRIQVQLMQQGYNELLASGIIYQTPQPAVKLSTGQVFASGGFQSVRALNTLSLLVTGSGSTNSAVLDALRNNTTIKSLLSSSTLNLNTITSGAVNSLTTGLNNLGDLSNLSVASITSGITQQLGGSVGALVANASKFGTQATALWAKAGNLDLGSLAGTGLTNLSGSLTSNLSSITTNLTNLVPGSLTNLTSSLDVFGKAGSFATNFANPLASLDNLGNLGGLLTSGGGIGGAITSNLGSLTNLGSLGNLSGALGNLGSFANIGAVGDLFGGGGDLVSGTAVAAGFNNTVNRSTVDAAFARIVGSNKVPLPTYQYPSLASLAPRLDIQQALNFLKGQGTANGGTFGQTVTV